MNVIAQLRGLLILTDLLNLAITRYGEESARVYLRTLLAQAKIQRLHGLRAVQFVSDEYETLRQLEVS